MLNASRRLAYKSILTWWYVLKMSWRHLCKTSWRRPKNVLKMSWRRFCKTSWRRLENVLKTSWQDVLKTSWRRLENVLKTSWRRMAKTKILVLTKTSSEDVWVRRIYSSWSRRLLKTKTKDVFKTYSSRQMFAGVHLFNCYLASPRPTLSDHYRGDSLTYSMLITTFLHI